MKIDLEKIRESTGLKSVFYKQVIESTNDWAIKAGRDQETRLPALFVASEQTRGRGRDDKPWTSSCGSLTFSLLVSRSVSLEDNRTGLVALLAADSICETVEEICGLSPKIKWPNDVYLFDRKLAGILIESVGASMLVIGCGVNISNSIDSIPFATNLSSLLPKSPSIEMMMSGIARRMVDGLKEIASEPGFQFDDLTCSNRGNGFNQGLLERCRARDWLSGRLIECTTPGESIRGTSRGFSRDGSLIIEIDRGERRAIRTGSIRVLESQTN